jgi:hypothetical protein
MTSPLSGASAACGWTISDQTSSSFTWRASRHQALAGVAGTAVLRMCDLET